MPIQSLMQSLSESCVGFKVTKPIFSNSAKRYYAGGQQGGEAKRLSKKF